MLDESFLKSLTRNFTFSVYIRSGVGFNGNGGPQDWSDCFSICIGQNMSIAAASDSSAF